MKLHYTVFFFIFFCKNACSTIPDTYYEQVISDRYLFAPFANDSTSWPILSNVQNVLQIIPLPRYFDQASSGAFLLCQLEPRPSLDEQSQVFWMSTTSGGHLLPVSNLRTKLYSDYIVMSHDEQLANLYTGFLISIDHVDIFLCSQFNITECSVVHSILLPSILSLNTTKITTGLFIRDGSQCPWLYFGADSGLHAIDLSSMKVFPYINQINVSVSSLAWSFRRETLFVGTAKKLWLQTFHNSSNDWRFEHVTAFIDAPIVSLAYNDIQDKLWIGQTAGGVTLLSPIFISPNKTHWYFTRLAGHISNPGSDIGHLPYSNITVISIGQSSPADAYIWLGCKQAIMRFNANSTNSTSWRVFNSARYVPNRDSVIDVSSLAVLTRNLKEPSSLGSTAIAVTNRGLAVLRFEMWTLEEKAGYLQNLMDRSSRHKRYGYVSDCSMSSWGDVRTCVKGPNDNDGLWTSMYLGSQVLRYAVTRDPSVKEQAWQHFEALEILNQVSGISGYPSRSLARRDEFPPQAQWYPSPIYPDLQFKGDTSSDEIVGHEFVYPLVHDLLAETDEERLRAYNLILNITTHILTHNWYLIGENHNHTTWGIWNPRQINDDSFYQETRGLNSLQILAFLLQTYAYSNDTQFLNGAKLLIDTYQYDVNIINQKTISVCDNSFSDDELAYLSYFNFAYAVQTMNSTDGQILIEHLMPYLEIGLDLSHRYKSLEKTPFYNFIYCFVSGQVFGSKIKRISAPAFNCDNLSKDGIWYLQRWPLELINWQQFNGNRLDIHHNIDAEKCFEGSYSLKPLPPDERSTKKWNGGPYDLDDGDGYSEDDPAAFLLSYWGMRYFNLLK